MTDFFIKKKKKLSCPLRLFRAPICNTAWNVITDPKHFVIAFWPQHLVTFWIVVAYRALTMLHWCGMLQVLTINLSVNTGNLYRRRISQQNNSVRQSELCEVIVIWFVWMLLFTQTTHFFVFLTRALLNCHLLSSDTGYCPFILTSHWVFVW